jgi:hypothetical protein
MTMRILVYGSSLACQLAVENILRCEEYTLMGHIPNKKPPTVQGVVPLPIVDTNIPHDIKLALGYDEKIKDHENAYNMHQGILPNYGGCDMLFHALKRGERYVGLTFHKMTSIIDEGPIISTIQYPIMPNDTVLTLYDRMLTIYPLFVSACLKLLVQVGIGNIHNCQTIHNPTMYRRGQIPEEFITEYKQNKEKLEQLGIDHANNRPRQ